MKVYVMFDVTAAAEVLGVGKKQYRNVALRKPANLSSVWRSDSDAFNAVDGIGIVTVSGPEHCAHSDGYERNPHLTIDLQNLFYIDHLLLLTRGDTSAEFFHDVEVRIGNLTIWEEMKTCGLFSETAELGQWYKIQCASCLVGRFVTIKITGDRMMTDHDGNLLSLCEVSVWGRRYYNS
ncbi:uncharacterized protein LOC134261194 [Saccostrea cucullata]|uniref:uncharacterized protein LOC134261194 n=1 Tax=Saccostrea cuccullata TaxID=36930 RepID=UPI002ED2D9A7